MTYTRRLLHPPYPDIHLIIKPREGRLTELAEDIIRDGVEVT